MNIPTAKLNFESKRIFVESKIDETKFPVTLSKGILTINTFGENIIFTKNSRGNCYHDSRQRKPITESEFISEVKRLLDGNTKTQQIIFNMTGKWE